MSELSDENVQNVLVRHGAELKTLSEGFRETNLKLDQVFTELRSLGNNLTIISSQPNVSVSDIFDNIIKVGTIAGLAVAGILYVNQAFISSDLEKFRATDERIVERLDSQKTRIDRLETLSLYKGSGYMPPVEAPK